MDEYAFVAGLVVQSVFLSVKGKCQPTSYGDHGDHTSEVHIGQCPCEASSDQSECEGTDPPADELSFETFVNKGLLQPLVNSVHTDHHTPKNALMTTDTKTRKMQDPIQPINSLLMSWSPEFHLI